MSSLQFYSALAVEDDPEFLSILELMLGRCGFRYTVTAPDGFAAREYLKDRRFDLIISDWNMELMDGIELLIRVRKDPYTAKIPFILMTASLAEAPWRGAIQYGATEFLLKPFTLQELNSACLLCLSLREFKAGVMPLQARLKQRHAAAGNPAPPGASMSVVS